MATETKVKIIITVKPTRPVRPVKSNVTLNSTVTSMAAKKAIERIRKSQEIKVRKEKLISCNIELAECLTCMEATETVIVATCLHRNCKDCTFLYWKDCLGKQIPLECPGCDLKVSIKALSTINIDEEFQEYYEHQRRMLSKEIKMAHALPPCPLKYCKKGVLSQCTGYGRKTLWWGKYSCDACRKDFCVFCNKVHRGECQHVNLRIKANRDIWLKNKGLMECSRCHHGIQKNGGCQFVTCCKLTICSICNKQVKNKGIHRCK